MDTQNYQFRGPTALKNQAIGREEGREEGRQTGTTASILLFLEARGLNPTPEQHARIEAQRDLKVLEVWVSRAATVSAVDELFLE